MVSHPPRVEKALLSDARGSFQLILWPVSAYVEPGKQMSGQSEGAETEKQKWKYGIACVFVCGVCVLFSDSQCACVHVSLLYVCCAGLLGKVNSCSSQDRKPLISANENRRPY